MNEIDWKKEINKLSAKDRGKYAEAINTLMKWEVFQREWAWTKIKALYYLLTE